MEHADINFIFQSMMGVMHVPFLQYTDKVIEPAGDAREELYIYPDLAKACGGKFFGSGFLQFMINAGSALARIPLLGKKLRFTSEKLFGIILRISGVSSIKKMRKHPHGILLKEHRYKSFLGKRVLTSDGLIDLAPPVITELCADIEKAGKEIMADKDTILLLNKRETKTHNTYIHNAPTLMKKRKTNLLFMNTDDAEQRTINQGDMVRVTSRWGSVELPAEISSDIMPGSAAIPFGWGHGKSKGLQVAGKHPGVNPNELTPSGVEFVDRVSGMARLSGVPVEIERVQEE
jgi:anaerobic selenocysteine-containing dehydrogenase